MHRLLAASIAFALMGPVPGLAAACPQARAIYTDKGGIYELRFEPVGSQSAVTSNHFKIAVGKTGLLLDGIVLQSGEPVRPNGMIMHDCPEGDVTGADIAACTIWQGVVYAVGSDGRIDALGAEDGEAAAALLLPDLGPSIVASSIWGKTTAAPWDVLTLKGCAS